MRFYFVNYAFIYTIFIFHVCLVFTTSLDDYFPYTSPTENMKKAGFGDGIRDYNFVFPKKVNANDLQLSHFYKIDAYDENQTSRRGIRASVEHSPSYLLALRNKDNSEELELQIDLKPNINLAPRSLLIERLDKDSWMDVGKAKLQPLGDQRCFFVGHISGQPGSTVAVSACGKGLLGVVQLRDDRFYIQPLTTEEAQEGQNPHIVYRKKPRIESLGKPRHCFVKEPIEEPGMIRKDHLVGNFEGLQPSLSNSVHDIYNFEKVIVDESPRIESDIEMHRALDNEWDLKRMDVSKRNGKNLVENGSSIDLSFYESLVRNLESSIADLKPLISKNYRHLKHANKLHHLNHRKRRDLNNISQLQNQAVTTQLFEKAYTDEDEYTKRPVLSNLNDSESNLSSTRDEKMFDAINKSFIASIDGISSHKGDEKINIVSRRDLSNKSNVSISTETETATKIQLDEDQYGNFTPAINEISLQHLIPLEDISDNSHMNSIYAYNEPLNIDSQTHNLKANFDKEVSMGGNSQNEILRAGRSCQIVPVKKKIEPIYDVRVLVVLSKHFSDQFDTFDTETLVLTLMNMVHIHFLDASIGQLIYVKIVRIIYIQYDMVELDEKKHSLEELFANFCKFQERVNPVLLTHPNRHDIAIFMTQLNIHDTCGSPPVYGVTFSKSVCREDKKCILVTNHGLLTANIITHAIGHSLGAVHDDGGEGNCDSKAEDGTNHLMSPTISYNAISWSSCSRRAISRFVRHHASKCLLGCSKAVEFDWSNEMLAGQIYTASQQCTLNYRMPTMACFNGDFCTRLFCKMTEHECASNGEPPADGTYCAKNMWCIKGQCLWKGAHVASAINGGWSNWGTWSPCSRHCGIGVQRAMRVCNNPPPAKGGKICAGRRTRYRVCNQHVPCPISDPSFRDEQCQLTSAYPHDDVKVDWHEWSGGPEAEEIGCSLVCESFLGVVAVRDVPAANGTPCRPGTNDLCVRGKCIPVGCDWALGSRARRDACGICRGGGTTCQIIQGVYNEKNGTGYVPFLKVSRGSAMIYVREMKPSDALLAVSSSNAGDFHLNGPTSEDDLASAPALSKRFEMAGATTIYKVKSGMERLFIDGTVQEDLIFYLKFGTTGNPGVRYQLAVNRDPKSPFEPFYSWRFINWERCSNPCGGGHQVAEPMCVEETNGIVDDSYCPDELRPMPITRLCNSFPCKPKWWVGPWSKCSMHSNKRIKSRAVLCVLSQGVAANSFRIIKDCQCVHAKKPCCSKPCRIKTSAGSQGGACNYYDNALQPNSIKGSGYYLEPSSMGENHDLLQNNKWNRRISNFHTNDNIKNEPYFTFKHRPPHENLENIPSYLDSDDDDDDYNEHSIAPYESLDSGTIEGDNSTVDTQFNSSPLQRTNVLSAIGDNLRIENKFDGWEDNSESDEYRRVQRSLGEINEKYMRRKKRNKSKNKKAENSNEDDIFNQFFDEAGNSNSKPKTESTVKNTIEHITQPTIYDVFDDYSTAVNKKPSTDNIVEHNYTKNKNKSEIIGAKDVNSNLESKEMKKYTPTSSRTLYGLLLTNKLGEPSNLNISKLQSHNVDSVKEEKMPQSNNGDSIKDKKTPLSDNVDSVKEEKTPQSNNVDSIEEEKTPQSVLPDTLQLLMHNVKNITEDPELTTTRLTEVASTEATEVITSKEKQKIQEAPVCHTETCFSLATGPTCPIRCTTCRHPDLLCPPTASPDTPRKICHEIIENCLPSFTLIRAPIACEGSVNTYSDGLYEGDGILGLLPVVNETCPILLKGDAALKYLEDRRRCFYGPIQRNILLVE